MSKSVCREVTMEPSLVAWQSELRCYTKKRQTKTRHPAKQENIRLYMVQHSSHVHTGIIHTN